MTCTVTFSIFGLDFVPWLNTLVTQTRGGTEPVLDLGMSNFRDSDFGIFASPKIYASKCSFVWSTLSWFYLSYIYFGTGENK